MKKQRAFLKWAGGKYGLVEDIQRHLPPARKLVEPFVGAGSIFLNTDFEQYLLADINPDLINLYNLLKEQPELYITESKRWFTAENNRKEAYIALKDVSNNLNEQDFLELLNSDDPYTSLKQIHLVSEDQLQYISTLTPHAILSMIKEIRSA